MNRNEKILAGVLGLFLAGYLLRGPLEALTVGPVNELQETVDARFAKAETLSDRVDAITLAAGRVNAARRRSLPADVSYANRLYPQWLGDLATASGWSDVRTELRAVQARRDEQFRPVRVELRGLATLDELDTFLRRFQRTDLAQRINSCRVFSQSEVGDVDLDVLIEAEAISMPTASQREEIFPIAQLTTDLAADGETAAVSIPAGLTGAFPEEPGFLVRAGTEFLRVEAIAAGAAGLEAEGEDGEADRAAVWTFVRGTDGSAPQAQAAGTFLQLWPRIEEPGELLAFSETGPFRKPRSYEPRLNVAGPTRLVRGDEFTLTAAATDFDARGGDPVYAAGDLPPGAAFDPGAGRLTWDPPDDLPAGEYGVTLTATVPKPETTLTQTVALVLADRNTPPTVSSVESQTVNAGDVVLFEAEASDAEDGPEVTFSLVDPPEGAVIDATFGLVRWEVPATRAPGEATLTVRATDAGSPPLSGETGVQVTVTEDLRPFVKFVGRTTRNDDAVATLFNQAENRITKVRVGDRFSLVGVEGVVLAIGRDTLDYARGGRRYRLPLGASLADAADRGEREEPAPGPPEQTDAPDDGGEAAPLNDPDPSADTADAPAEPVETAETEETFGTPGSD